MSIYRAGLILAIATITSVGLSIMPSSVAFAAEDSGYSPPPRANRDNQPYLPYRFVRSDNPKLFDARVKYYREQALANMHIKGRFTVAVAGDVIDTYPIAQLANPLTQAAFNILRSADVAFGNEEYNLVDYHSATCCLGGMMGPKATAADMRAMGFRLMNKASNHGMDEGETYFLQQFKILRDAGIVVAGSGRNLQEARAPAFLMIPKGRMAVVGSYAGVVRCHQCPPASQNSPTDAMMPQLATYQLGFDNGSPGEDPLRLTEYHVLPKEDLNTLRAILRKQNPRVIRVPTSGPLNFYGRWYEAGPDSERGMLRYQMYPDDLFGIERSVRNGKEQSDFLVVGVHAHETVGIGGQDNPGEPDFLVAYAHDVIDNGADMFVASGPWDLRGIELYKGKPIFYGLGEFVCTVMSTPVGYDRYRDEGLDPFTTKVTPMELNWTAWDGPDILKSTDLDNITTESYLASVVYENGKLTEIDITPIELAYDRPISEVGIPRVATGEVAQRILSRVQMMSRPFGTHVVVKDDKGYIYVNADGKSE